MQWEISACRESRHNFCKLRVNGSITERSFKSNAVLVLGTRTASRQNFFLGQDGTRIFAPGGPLIFVRVQLFLIIYAKYFN
jgi:hypothetical protein